MKIKRLHQIIKTKYNKLDSNSKVDLPVAFIDDAINEGINEFIEIFYSGNNAKQYNLGFEVTQQRIDMLSTFVISYPEQSKLAPINHGDVYELPFDNLVYDYKHLVRAWVDTDCGVINITPKQHDDLNKLLNDEYQKPSKAWKRIPAKIAKSSLNNSSSLYMYTNGEFSIENVYIEYIKKPTKVFSGGYDTLEFTCGDLNAYNKNTEPVNPEITEYPYLLAEIVVKLLSGNLRDYNDTSYRDQKIFNKS